MKALARWLQVLTLLIAVGCAVFFAVIEAWWPAIGAAWLSGGLTALLIRDVQDDLRLR